MKTNEKIYEQDLNTRTRQKKKNVNFLVKDENLNTSILNEILASNQQMNEFHSPEKLIDEPQVSTTATCSPINKLIESNGSVISKYMKNTRSKPKE